MSRRTRKVRRTRRSRSNRRVSRRRTRKVKRTRKSRKVRKSRKSRKVRKVRRMKGGAAGDAARAEWGPLIAAVKANDAFRVNFVANQDRNWLNYDVGGSPLWHAEEANNEPIAKLLVELGAPTFINSAAYNRWSNRDWWPAHSY